MTNKIEKLFWEKVGEKDLAGWRKEQAEDTAMLIRQGRCPRCGGKCEDYCFN